MSSILRKLAGVLEQVIEKKIEKTVQELPQKLAGGDPTGTKLQDALMDLLELELLLKTTGFLQQGSGPDTLGTPETIKNWQDDVAHFQNSLEGIVAPALSTSSNSPTSSVWTPRNDFPADTRPAPAGSLRETAQKKGLMMGAAVDVSRLNDPAYAKMIADNFNYLTPENAMKWDATNRNGPTADYTDGDKIMAFAKEHGMQVKGHTLVWHAQLPAWVDGLSPDQFNSALMDHIKDEVGHYKGQMYSWDVINEPLDDNTGQVRGDLAQRLGPHASDFIHNSFVAARQADPNAKLFYNDYGLEWDNTKWNATYELLKNEVARGTPIDGVGLQMHLSAKSPPDIATIVDHVKKLQALGLTVNISEMDIDPQGDPAMQEKLYHDVVQACTAAGVKQITMWTPADATSGWGAGQQSGLFTTNYQTKESFKSLQSGLQS